MVRWSSTVLSSLQPLLTILLLFWHPEEPILTNYPLSFEAATYGFALRRSIKFGTLSTPSDAHPQRKLPEQNGGGGGGGSNLILLQVPRLGHLSCHLGLGPNRLFLRPNFKRCSSISFLQKPRYCVKRLLSSLSFKLCRFMESMVCGRHLISYHTSLLCLLNIYLKTCPLESPRSSIKVSQSLKKTLSDSLHYHGRLQWLRQRGTMISAPRSGDYRCFLNHVSSYPLLTVFSLVQFAMVHSAIFVKLRFMFCLYVLDRLQNVCGFLNLHGSFHVREDPPILLQLITYLLQTLCVASSYTLSHEFALLKIFGISSLTHPCDINIFVQTSAKALRCVVLLVQTRRLPLAPSSTPFRLLTLAIRSSNDLFLEEASTTFDLTCSTKLLTFWFKALKDHLPSTSCYLVIFLVLTLGYALYYCADRKSVV